MSIEDKFKKMFKSEFEDPNEAFQAFLLSLIPKNILTEVLEKGGKIYYSRIKEFM